MDEVFGFWAHSQCLPWPGLFFFKLMNLGIWFLTTRFTSETGPSTWSLSNDAIWSSFSIGSMKKDILMLREECVLQKRINPWSSYLTSSAYLFSSRQHQAAPVLGGVSVSACLLQQKDVHSVLQTLLLKNWLVQTFCNEIKAGRKAGVVTAGRAHLLSAPCFDSRAAQSVGMSSQLCLVGRKELISACLPFRDSTA